jgi:hypothetical protein
MQERPQCVGNGHATGFEVSMLPLSYRPPIQYSYHLETYRLKYLKYVLNK